MEIAESPKLYYYSMYKNDFEIESYLLTNMPRKVKKQFARFRLANHNLQIEKGRHTNLCREDRLCLFCNRVSNLKVIECEYHLCMECLLYDDMRKQCPNVSFDKNLFNFNRIMSTKDHRIINELAWYIWKCFTVRTEFMKGELI